MHLTTIVLAVLLILFGFSACSPTAARPPRVATTAAPTPVSTQQGNAEFTEAISARAAFALAEDTAKASNPNYQLFEVLGCHSAGQYGDYERDSHLVEGTCARVIRRRHSVP